MKQKYNDNRVIGKGVRHYHKYIIGKHVNIKRQDVENFIKTDELYQMTRPKVHRINKPIIAKYPNQVSGIDLIHANNKIKKFRYIITIDDMFSRKV